MTTVVLDTNTVISAVFWPRSRDAKDDPFLACAPAAKAGFVITRDDELLALGKPFGIEMITPARFLVWRRGKRRR